ncbi:MAG: hypothetical protein O4803_14425 [Trichodesmium sp. St15_bin1_1]|nr:hypothetical protein [Trichodesmium sp. St16_bin2-tuft]MDE5115372.1 hypothetical protein [Trichodesmium sp. St15_bin1_1]
MDFSIKSKHWLLLSIVCLSSVINCGNANKALAHPLEVGAEEAIAQTNTSEPPRRNKPTFFEEEQDPEFRGDGFSNTFLRDALGGVANPLSGNGSSSTTVDSLQKVEFNAGGSRRPTDNNGLTDSGTVSPGITPGTVTPGTENSPSFDRTNVIIR